MAGISWIKIETTLPNKPVVQFVKRACKRSRYEVIGLLISLLCWADGITEDGTCEGYTLEDIDEHFGVDGFASGLVAAGWIAVNDAGWVQFCGWNLHNGECAKKRALNARANNRYRTRKNNERDENVMKNNHESITSLSQNDELDKIRKDNIKENTKRKGPGFVTQGKHTTTSTHIDIHYEGATSFVPTQGREKDFLDAFCRRPKDGNMFRREYANAVKEIGDEETLIECARLAVASERENEGNIRFLPTPENWLADHRYRDYQGTAKTTKPLELIDIY